MQNFIVHLVQNIYHQVQNIMPAGLPSIDTEHQGTSTQGVVARFDITYAENIRNHHVGMQWKLYVKQGSSTLMPQIIKYKSYQMMIQYYNQ